MIVIAKPYEIEKYTNERDWKRGRVNGVGASESSAVVRLSKWCSEFGLYYRKAEGRVEDDGDGGPMADAGHRHEPTIAKWFLEQEQVDQHGMQFMNNPGDFTVFRSTERPHMTCTVDRLVSEFGKEWNPLELKCAWYDSAREWNDKIPISYQVQLQHQLYVTGAQIGFFAVLLNGYDFRFYAMERHDKFIRRLCSHVDAFWERVQTKNPPQACGHKSSLWTLFQKYPKSEPTIYDIDNDDLVEQARKFDTASATIKEATEVKDTAKARIQQAMQAHELARLPDGSGFSWKTAGKQRRFTRVETIKDDRQ